MLENGACRLLKKAGFRTRSCVEGLVHDPIFITAEALQIHLDLQKHTSRSITIYGLHEVTYDFY